MPSNAELNARLNHMTMLWNKFACGEGMPVPYEHPDPEPKEDK